MNSEYLCYNTTVSGYESFTSHNVDFFTADGHPNTSPGNHAARKTGDH